MKEIKPVIENKIFVIRDHRVMLDADLAILYGVPTKRLNEQVKRNSKRFPKDFVFQLTEIEKDEVVAICDHLSDLKFSHSLPYAFTEHGVAMLSAVLNSKRAIEMSIFIVKSFIRMRELLSTQKDVVYKIDKIVNVLKAHDDHLAEIQDTIDFMTREPIKPKHKMGFSAE